MPDYGWWAPVLIERVLVCGIFGMSTQCYSSSSIVHRQMKAEGFVSAIQ